MRASAPLMGRTVVVTRPLAQAGSICESLERMQAKVVYFPTIRITAVKNIASAKKILRQLEAYDMVIFISTNAVHYAVKVAQELGLSFQHKRLAAIGLATRTTLENYGFEVSITAATRFTSEALLAHARLQQLAGQKILIVRGSGGREHLRQELQSRGAQVDYAEVYQRQLPTPRNTTDLCTLPEQDAAVLIHSAESVQNLCSLCSINERQWLTHVTLIVGSERIAEAASSVGCVKNLIIAENSSDEAMLNAVSVWAQETGSPGNSEEDNL